MDKLLKKYGEKIMVAVQDIEGAYMNYPMFVKIETIAGMANTDEGTAEKALMEYQHINEL